jgi:iron complex outermembrane receptor protein
MANSTRTAGLLPLVLGSLGAVGTVSAADQAEAAQAPDAAAAATASDARSEEVTEVVVTGYRMSLRNAIEQKKNSDVMMDAINAEDIADFPDANLAESLQRLPGVALDRDNGEGRGITVRGLGADFTRVRLNGLETTSSAAASDSGAAPNRGRGFDFNVFASDLFSSLEVRKTASASMDEGSLGATVDLVTGKPLDYKGRKLALAAEDAYYENGETHNPRIALLAADQWFDGRLGFSFSGAYSERDSQVDRYRRQQGQSDYLYRNSQFNGNELPQRGGFAVPVGTVLTPGFTNTANLAALTGSDPLAYAALYPGGSINSPDRFDDAAVRIPSLLNIEQQDLSQERLGITTALQWQPTETTNLGLDLVYSKFDQKSDVNQIQSVGLNRNNTSANYNGLGAMPVTPTQAQINTRRGLYQTCASQAASAFREGIDCGGLNPDTDGVFAGLGTTSFSTNPNNLDTYDYYNNPLSPGYVNSPDGAYFVDRLIGRPGVDVLAAHVSEAGNADYLELRNIDWRSATDASYFTTEFKQASLTWQQDIGDQLKMDVLYGKSRSTNDNQAFLVEFNRMDSPETFIYDERAHGSMPSINYGFNLADSNNWSLVKGFSAIRSFLKETDNDYEGGHLNFDLKLSESLHFEFGGTRREFKFKANEGRRLSNEAQNPTLGELGLTSADLGRVYQFGQGLDLPDGVPTSFFAPNLDAFREEIGFDCNCLNEFGDWRLGYLSNPGNQFSVDEYDSSYFAQLDFDFQLFGNRMFGNAGFRKADTQVRSVGFTTALAGADPGPRPLIRSNEYSDDLPSFNVAYQLGEDFIIRAGWAKVMARPLLANLSPSITGLTLQTAATSFGSVTVGNPMLDPFRAKNMDLSFEWYFTEGGLFSVALFKKEVSNFPQTVSTAGSLQSLLTPEEFQAIYDSATPAQQAWLVGAGGEQALFGIRRFENAPGGEIEGYEISYQQDLTFLPGFLKNFGVQANFTHLQSELQYILDPGSAVAPVSPQVTTGGPFFGASPNSANATLYYETPKWSARVSWAFRDRYVSLYPLAAGTCAPGLNTNVTPAAPCNTPLMNDFVGSEATRNIDAKVTWQATDFLSISIEGLNLTNQTEDRWAYRDEPLVTQYSSTGRQIFAGFRLSL